jgi:hypothetical protein
MFKPHSFFRATAALALLITAGCQSSPTAPSQAMVTPQRAVVVSAGQSGAMTVFLPSDDSSNPIALCTAGTDVCPECKAAAVKYFQTRVLDPKCSRTGATRTATTLFSPTFGHN